MNNNTATLSPETLPAIMWQNQPVITTELLAVVYGTAIDNIQKNFERNIGRFIEGIHFFLLKGADLKDFKANRLKDGQLVINKFTRSLYLWTERGTVRHAKILDTDNAWLVQDRLEDSYFAKNAPVQYGLKSLQPSPYISEAEASQFKKSLEQHCKGERQQYSLLYRKVYDYYGVTSYKHIPNGKMTEAARLIGVKLVMIKKPNLPPEPLILTFTQEQVDIQIAEAIRQVQGELVNQAGSSITIALNGETTRFIVWRTGNSASFYEIDGSVMVGDFDTLTREFNKLGFMIIEKSKLEDMQKQLGILLA